MSCIFSCPYSFWTVRNSTIELLWQKDGILRFYLLPLPWRKSKCAELSFRNSRNLCVQNIELTFLNSTDLISLNKVTSIILIWCQIRLDMPKFWLNSSMFLFLIFDCCPKPHIWPLTEKVFKTNLRKLDMENYYQKIRQIILFYFNFLEYIIPTEIKIAWSTWSCTFQSIYKNVKKTT